MAIYEITYKGKERLVEAKTKSAAIMHVVKPDLFIESVSASDLHKLIKAGAEVETVSAEEEKSAA